VAGFLGLGIGGRGKADPDPNPGIGGYDYPRGPEGKTGYPGSTTANRLNPDAASKLADGTWGRGEGSHRHFPRRAWIPIQQQQVNLQSNPGERQGGLPWRANTNNLGSDDHRGVQDTQERIHEDIISARTPFKADQRNQVYYGGRKAVPGAPVTMKAAPRPDQGFRTRANPADVGEVTVPSRHVFRGVNGGTDVVADLLHRRMPYTGHAGTVHEVMEGHGGRIGALSPGFGNRNVRGAVLDGTRFYQVPDTELNQGGDYGRYRKSHPSRPTVFQEPAPWSAGYYDTSDSVGGPDTPGSGSQVWDSVYTSPEVARTSYRRGG
jgi:hypothetical protein